MTPFVAKCLFVGGVMSWVLIRYPFQRRAWKHPVLTTLRDGREQFLLAIAAAGLGLVPLLNVAGGFPRAADHSFSAQLAWVGAISFSLALWLFYRSHHDLGPHFSESLDLRIGHALVTDGIYRHLRHPMYLGFWLWALAQVLLLPNWFAGCAGIAGFSALYFGRLYREEQMMVDQFGERYRDYAKHTARIVPWLL
jgi:protein-S-isoprenylcysteine O-methyltransferase Ste14